MDGRKIEFQTLDDGYEPPKAVQNARRLVEQEKVFALFNTLGTPNNLAIWDYMNEQKVPQVYVATGASDWGEDIEAHPCTIGWQPNYVTEAQDLRRLPQEGEAEREGRRCCTRTTASARTCSAASRRRSRART